MTLWNVFLLLFADAVFCGDLNYSPYSSYGGSDYNYYYYDYGFGAAVASLVYTFLENLSTRLFDFTYSNDCNSSFQNRIAVNWGELMMIYICV